MMSGLAGLEKTIEKTRKNLKRRKSGAVKKRESMEQSLYRQLGRPRSRTLSTKINYSVPDADNIDVIAQPSGKSCWATVFTMMYGWKTQTCLTIEKALSEIGPKWVKLFKDNTGLSANDKKDFVAKTGLVAEPPMSLSILGWEKLLRDYGPIWVTTDEAPGDPWAIHARIIVAIRGDGTPAGTKFKIIDPAGGREYTESIDAFWPKYEEEVTKTKKTRIQILHWPKDARSGATKAMAVSEYLRMPIAMETPSNPKNYRKLTSGSWNSNTTLKIQGGQGMWFKVTNTNVLGTTIRITDNLKQSKSSIIPPLGTANLLFTCFGNEPMSWTFDIRTESSAFLVTWELWSTWVPGMPNNPPGSAQVDTTGTPTAQSLSRHWYINPEPALSRAASFNPAAMTSPANPLVDCQHRNHYKKELSISGGVQSGSKGEDAKKVQEWLNLWVHASPDWSTKVEIDGDFGSETETAVKKFQKMVGQPESGQVDNATFEILTNPLRWAFTKIDSTTDLRQLILAYAEEHVKSVAYELNYGGQGNRGPWVRSYMLGHDGENYLWCVGFVQTILDLAFSTLGKDYTTLMPITGSCDDMGERGLSDGVLIRNNELSKRIGEVKPGDLFLSVKAPRDWNHIGLVTGIIGNSIQTIEGNTDHKGSNNGIEVCSRSRDYTKKNIDIFKLTI